MSYYAKFQSSFDSEKKKVLNVFFLPYMGMKAILVK